MSGSSFSSSWSDTTYEIRFRSDSGGPRLVSAYTLRELFQRYSDILWENGPHKYNVTFFIGELNELLLGRRFSSFGQDMVDELIGKLRENGNSNATINRKIAALRKLLRKALAMGDLHSLPEFRRQKERAGRIRFLDQQEEARLLERVAAHSQRFHRLTIFLIDTGARLSEAFRLRWPDTDGASVTFWLTKSGRSRTVPLTARARAALEESRGEPRGPFAGITGQQYRAVWNQVRAEMGLSADRDFVPHILRHTCASRLVKGGIDIRRVQMWLGHQTLAMTMRYAHLATADLTNCVAVLEQFPAAPTPVSPPQAAGAAEEELSQVEPKAKKRRAAAKRTMPRAREDIRGRA
jgi:integrase